MDETLPGRRVWVAKGEASYSPCGQGSPVELPPDAALSHPLFLLRSLLRDAGLDAGRFGTPQWNPLGDVVQTGDTVLVKPNWVIDKNKIPAAGTDCLVTHPAVIEAVLHYVVKAKPGRIVLGDAPVQDCDFENLMKECGLPGIVKRFRDSGHLIDLRDFRLTRRRELSPKKEHTEPDPESYCQFDLGQESWLTPITDDRTEFRVTNYDPDVLKKHHNPGTHQYLIAREALDADVVVSLPKLKTHQKAGITGALKNMVGINGFKEYLPHHRKGGVRKGGDCYEGGGTLRRFAEDALDRANRSRGAFIYGMNRKAAGLAARLHGSLFGDYRNLEGSWYGNDTVWRMCLDLQRILHYGKADGELAITPQRKVLTITDAILAGEGNGPLAPTPVPLGIMTLGMSVAALDYIHCLLMGLDPGKVPLVTHAFGGEPWPLTDFSPEDIQVVVDGKSLPDLESVRELGRDFIPPPGWKGHCEKKRQGN